MKTGFLRLLFGLFLAHSAIAQSLGPSPTESVGCTAREGRWYCEGRRIGTTTPNSTGTAAPPVTTSPDRGHDDDAGTGSLKPSPTESTGCEPHGDHWHCDGPAGAAISTTSTGNGAAKTSSAATAGAAGAVNSGKPGMLGAGVMGMVALVAQAL